MLCCVVLYYIILYYIILQYYNLKGPPSYMRSVVDRNVVMRRMTVYLQGVEMEKLSFSTAWRHIPQGSLQCLLQESEKL